MAAVVPSRLAALTRLRCEIFQTSYNPTSVRTGAKYLRARLRGPSMINYYPEELTVARFNRMAGDFKIQDWAEYQRLADVEEKKRRGKGVPKKAKTQGACRLVYELLCCLPLLVYSGQSEDVSQAVIYPAWHRLSPLYSHYIYIPLMHTHFSRTRRRPRNSPKFVTPCCVHIESRSVVRAIDLMIVNPSTYLAHTSREHRCVNVTLNIPPLLTFLSFSPMQMVLYARFTSVAHSLGNLEAWL